MQDKDRSRILESARLPHTLAPLVFLGVDDRAHSSHQAKPAKVDPLCPEGVPYFALDVGKDGAEYEKLGGEWGDARGSANHMDGWTAGVFAQARALIDWNVRNRVSCRFESRLCILLMTVLPRLRQPHVQSVGGVEAELHDRRRA